MDLCNERQIKALLARHSFRFSKSMGQNFLIVPSIPQEIAAVSNADENCGVLEIGPGIGPLTAQLAQRAGKVVSVELDRALLPVLAETLAPYSNVEIVPGDILKLDLDALLSEKLIGFTPIICANLPYNITTPVLTRLLESGLFRSVTVLVQREVAHRICARPGTADYGAFSLFCQYHARCEIAFEVPPECFLPAPKVTSAVMRCVRRDQPAVTVADEDFFFRCVRGGFLLRRKTLANSLAAALPGVSREQVQQGLEACGLSPDVRGERLTLEQFARLSEILAKFLI